MFRFELQNEEIFFLSHGDYKSPNVSVRVMDYLKFMNSKVWSLIGHVIMVSQLCYICLCICFKASHNVLYSLPRYVAAVLDAVWRQAQVHAYMVQLALMSARRSNSPTDPEGGIWFAGVI